jgi:hypothetical protein
MKIIYVTVGGMESGVTKKLSDKISQIESIGGFEIKIHRALFPSESTLVKTDNQLSKMPIIWRLSILFRQAAIYRALRIFLQSSSLDLIIMRYPASDFFLWRLVNRLKCRIIFEHNSLELDELKLRSKDSFWFRYFYWSERTFGRLVRRKASALIGVTQEITRRQRELAGNKIPVFTISNGINVERVPVRTGPAYKGGILNLIFLAGSSAPWHGIDILLKSIEEYPNDCHCVIAGKISDKVRMKISDMVNVTYYNNLEGDELNALVNACHIGVGSLALFRNNMNEACTLKVREYWARGLPFILGYDDTDVVRNPHMVSYCKRIETAAGFFNFKSVIQFSKNVYSINNVNELIRDEARKTIDYKIKAEEYVRCFNTIR